MPADPDGDSEMLSSPESGKFPPASELSPPGSQGVPNTKRQMSSSEGLGAVSASFTNSRKGIDQKTSESTEAKNAPGASYMNKRAEEDYQRAMETVIDRDFTLREFGDPFDERDMSQMGS
ncbi:hypothetical protein FQN54_005761 [Arachnomyces sp. PD_36]|nr:hypothetical protein FQN54_005761 [Arachnomyces sp. PD_36]